MRIGVLGAADIALRRFLPALRQCDDLDYVGVASRTPEKAKKIIKVFGGKVYDSYEGLLADKTIEAVYVPLPPALHFTWGKRVLLAGKHLLMEKPFTTTLAETEELLKLAKEKHLAVHENYMFLYHSQLAKIKEMITQGVLGDIRLYRMSFGFPKRAQEDFRYNKVLGGGALLDCGGYPTRLALELLGETTKVTQSRLFQPKGYEVDLYGTATLENDAGVTAQIGFGMDNAYQCELQVWGSIATLSTMRIFTPPEELVPHVFLENNAGLQDIELLPDNAFLNSIRTFLRCVNSECERELHTREIWLQANLINMYKRGVER